MTINSKFGIEKKKVWIFINLNNCYYFFFSILYNRGVYPEESFGKVKKYGLPMLLTQDEGVKSFITNLTAQLSGIIFSGFFYKKYILYLISFFA